MNMLKKNTPNLIDPEIRYIIDSSLKQYHSQKQYNQRIMLNVGIFCTVVIGISIFLYYKKKIKDYNDAHIAERNAEKYQYIVSKMKAIRDMDNNTMLEGNNHFPIPIPDNNESNIYGIF